MTTAAVRPPPLPRHRGGVALALALLLLLSDALLGPSRRASADGPPAADVVSAIAAGFGSTGVLAVAVTVQQGPEATTARAADARAMRMRARTADNGDAARRPFPTASMVKLFIAEDILHRARQGRLQLSREDWAQLQDMIRRSDDPAASDFWVRFDGDRMVRDVAARYQLTDTRPPSIWGQWGETTTTALDLARFLARLPTVAHPFDASALLAWMRTATPVAADGFDQRFGVFGTVPGLPAVKQGWMCCVGGNRHLHSVGVVGSRVVVMLSKVPRAMSYDSARAALSAAATAIPPPHQP